MFLREVYPAYPAESGIMRGSVKFKKITSRFAPCNCEAIKQNAKLKNNRAKII